MSQFSKKTKFTIIIFFVAALLLLSSLFYTYFSPKVSGAKLPLSSSSSTSSKLDEEKEPEPFEDLTVPYLSSREYNSTLNALTLLSNNATYTSYLTSYDSDGLKVNGLLTKPSGKMPEGGWPAIVFIHGYIPPTTYQTTQNYVAYVDNLARNGFVVFKIDLRGHGTSEGIAWGGYYSSDYIIDAINAYSALQNSDFVNPKKIGMWGHSMAGNVIMRSVAAKKDIPAVVIWAGAVYTYDDFMEYGIDDNSYRPPELDSERQKRRKLLFDTHGEYSKDSDFWQRVVPTNYLDSVVTKIQLNHAVNDDVVSIEYSRNLMKVLDNTSIEHELHEYPNGGHNISDPSFSPAMANTVKFFKDNL